MASYTTPATWRNGEVSAATFNSELSERMRWFKGALGQLGVTSDTAKSKITPGLVGASMSVDNYKLGLDVDHTIIFDRLEWDSLTRPDQTTYQHNGYAVMSDGIGWFDLSDHTPDAEATYWLVTLSTDFAAMTAGHRNLRIVQASTTQARFDEAGIAAGSSMTISTLVRNNQDGFTYGKAGQSGEPEGIEISARMTAHRLSMEL